MAKTSKDSSFRLVAGLRNVCSVCASPNPARQLYPLQVSEISIQTHRVLADMTSELTIAWDCAVAGHNEVVVASYSQPRISSSCKDMGYQHGERYRTC
ncbi:Uncharacterized protein LW94_1802 [Fusarium fujikuroi]|nr:Uncharacterized protein Y057_2176 [Fusarium fujikuroi]KLP12846.1 Uncharacterized protein LW94_1802 [Fusarium fujikuroi]